MSRESNQLQQFLHAWLPWNVVRVLVRVLGFVKTNIVANDMINDFTLTFLSWFVRLLPRPIILPSSLSTKTHPTGTSPLNNALCA